MPGLYRDEGLVLKTMRLGEADRIVTLLLRDSGKVRAVVKGVRKTKSRWGARLEPFTHVDVMLYRGRGELDTVTSAHIVTSFDVLRLDYERLMDAAALVELVEKLTPDRENSIATYGLLLSGLHALAAGRGSSVVAAFFVKLLSISGYHPHVDNCAGCGTTDGLAGFSAALGGVVCEDCYNEDESAMRASTEDIALMRRFLATDITDVEPGHPTVDVTNMLRRYAEFHIERPLRSLRV
ncbi:MAG: DNA repair protein RecO [Actinomycetota bacterium]|nr:DNA repair protein RecO [Actinomycetota bacterium]